MNKAVFLDRDGTINIEKHYLHKIEDFVFMPGVVEGLNLLQNEGYLLIVVTNQSGIARGYYTEEDCVSLNEWMIQTLKESGIFIEKVYFCPHLPDATVEKYRMVCSCRKPGLGLYEEAIREFDINMKSSIAIGDKIRDCTVCEKYGCRGILIGNNEKQEIITAVKKGKYRNLEYAEDWYAVANRLIKKVMEE